MTPRTPRGIAREVEKQKHTAGSHREDGQRHSEKEDMYSFFNVDSYLQLWEDLSSPLSKPSGILDLQSWLPLLHKQGKPDRLLSYWSKFVLCGFGEYASQEVSKILKVNAFKFLETVFGMVSKVSFLYLILWLVCLVSVIRMRSSTRHPDEFESQRADDGPAFGNRNDREPGLL